MGDKAKKAGKGDKSSKRKKAKQAAPDAPADHGGAARIVEELREAGAKLVAAANSPAGREAIAVGLSIATTAAQAALSAKKNKPSPQGDTAAQPAGAKPTDHGAGQDALVAALGGVAGTLMDRLFKKA
jgi:hypothetical protein